MNSANERRKSREWAHLADAGEFNHRYLTCQISASLYPDRGDRRKSQSLHRAHLAIFADRGDRPIKSPSLSLALSSLLWFQSNVFVDQCVIVDQLLPSLQTPENAIHGPLAIYLSSSDLIPAEL